MQLIALRPEPEDLAHLGMDGEVGVALPVAQLGIGEAAEGDGAVVGPCVLPRGSGRRDLASSVDPTRPRAP